MSKYYGTVIGHAPTEANRRGYHEIRAAARTFDGSVIIEAHDDKDGNPIWSIELSDKSSAYGREVWCGTIEELAAALA